MSRTTLPALPHVLNRQKEEERRNVLRALWESSQDVNQATLAALKGEDTPSKLSKRFTLPRSDRSFAHQGMPTPCAFMPGVNQQQLIAASEEGILHAEDQIRRLGGKIMEVTKRWGGKWWMVTITYTSFLVSKPSPPVTKTAIEKALEKTSQRKSLQPTRLPPISGKAVQAIQA